MLYKRLERLREIKGISKAELARQIKMAPTTYSNYAHGKREPDIATLQMFADFYDVSIDYLINGSIKPTTSISKEITEVIDEFIELEPADQQTLLALMKRMKKNSR